MAGKRVTILLTVLATVGGAAAGAWYAGSRIESPADAAARTAPPTPSPILVPVEQRVLSSEIVTRGTVRFGMPQPISIAPSLLKGAASLITTLPARNTQFKEGDVVMTASGRPVFVFQGQVPAYRDLVPGISGEDVRQLKQAMQRLGFDAGPVDAPNDQRTSAAMAEFYKKKGFEPFGPTRDQLAAVRTLEREWGDAQKARIAADAASAAAGLAVASARATAAHGIRSAAMEAARSLQQSSGAQNGTGGKSLIVETERAKAQHANIAAAADVAAQIADQALIALDPRQPETARAAADAKLEMARAARERTKLEGELAVQATERDTKMTADKADLARAAETAARLEGEKSVRAAADGQKLAGIEAKMARDRAAQLAADLDAAREKLGIQIPVDEVIFIRALPVRVEEVTGQVGAAATGPVMTVTDNQLTVDSSLSLDMAPLVTPGMSVSINEQALGVKATGTVEMVASTPGTRGVDGFHVYLGVRVDTTTARLEGISVRLTIPIQTTKGAVTVVPVSALSLATDGSSRVQAEVGNALEYITVEPRLSAAGYVEVAAVGGKLTAGQRVVVGYNNPASRDQK
jgi:peptidoglycan hydrolase-like protein with peptidoglycan-binding domain